LDPSSRTGPTAIAPGLPPWITAQEYDEVNARGYTVVTPGMAAGLTAKMPGKILGKSWKIIGALAER